MPLILSNPTVTVNNTPVAIVPNSFKYNEGKGEQKTHIETTGGAVVNAIADDVTNHFSEFSFDLLPTDVNIETARAWKSNMEENVVRASQGKVTRTFAGATLINNYEVNMSADGNLSLTWNSNAAV